MKARCNKCQEIFKGEPDQYDVLVCPNCGAKMRVKARPDPATAPTVPVRPPSASRTPAAPPPSPTPSGGKLPAVMRANKVVAGRACPGCGAAIELGAPVRNCERCGGSHHEACWAAKGGCANEDCTTEIDVKPVARAGREPPPDDGEETKPCRFCGESIKANARKCRFCNEYQHERDRQMQAQQSSSPEDDHMSTGDWVVACLCSGIGCIAGIVWCIQGKKKGPKMVGVSIVMAILWNVVMAIANPKR